MTAPASLRGVRVRSHAAGISRNFCYPLGMGDQGLSQAKRAELRAHLGELDQMIEDQTAHVQAVLEMGLLAPVVALRLERLKEVRRRYLSALKHLLGDDAGSVEPGDSR